MIGRQSGQISMLVLDIEELTPKNHLLRQINQLVSFDFMLLFSVRYCQSLVYLSCSFVRVLSFLWVPFY